MKIFTPVSIIGGCASGPCCRLSSPMHHENEAKAPNDMVNRLSALSFSPPCSESPELSAALARIWEDMRREMLERSVRGEFSRAEDAVRCIRDELCALLRGSGDAYLRARAEDISAIGDHMLLQLSGAKYSIPRGCVLAAEQLSVLDAIEAVRCGAAAVVVRKFNSLSHAALVLRGSGIPVAIGLDLANFIDGQQVLVDGNAGQVVIDFEKTPRKPRHKAVSLQQEIPLPNGSAFRISLNCCGSWEQLPANIEIGLLRTEFFLQSLGRIPSEDELVQEYQRILKRNPVAAIRLFDAGGDKPVPGIAAMEDLCRKPEQRGVALLLAHRNMLELQLRAILRSAIHGDVRILLPILNSPAEIEAVRACMHACADALAAADLPHRKDLSIGAMIETPAAAQRSEEIARIADFGALGTNDLIHYAMGASRFEGSKPEPSEAVFDLIRKCAASFARAGKPLCVCGDLAADPSHVRQLISLGISRISAPPAAAQEVLRALLEEPLQV